MELPFSEEKFFNMKYTLWAFMLWQAISVFLMAVGAWPLWVTWLTVAAIAIFIVLASSYNTLLLLIVSLPFYTALPGIHSGSIPTWRVLFILAGVVWAVKYAYELRKPSLYRTVIKFFKSLYRVVNPWDYYLLALFVVVCVSAVFAHFRMEAVKQIIFILNAFIIYLIVLTSVRQRSQVVELIKYASLSLAVIIILGYVQLVLTFVLPQVFFWQYWATHVSQLYYGSGLAHVLTYSNSWFSYTGSAPELRMFSIMPDSHSFAVVGVLLIGYFLALTCVYLKKEKEPLPDEAHLIKLPSKKSYLVWNTIRLSGLTIILSGTRGVWVGLLFPLGLSLYYYFKKVARPLMKKIITASLLIILFFFLSPLINGALDYLHASRFQENFLSRARSIYDLNEDSNVGRLVIWQSSLLYSASHPLGVGFGNFVVSLVKDLPPGQSFDQVAQQSNLRYNLPQKFVSAHSLYLHLLVELGFIGLFVFLAFWASYLMNVYRFFMQNKGENSVYSTFVITMGFIFIWLLAYGIFDITLFNDKILIYSFISLALSGVVIRLYSQASDKH